MDSAGRDYALQLHGLNHGDPVIREKFRSICLDFLELTDQQALSILTDRATSILCTDITPERLQSIAHHFREIGVTVNIAEATDYTDVAIPFGTFAQEDPSTFSESQLFERSVHPSAALESRYDDYASGRVEEFFDHDKHFGLLSSDETPERQRKRDVHRHQNFLKKKRSLSPAERAGLLFVLFALATLAWFFIHRSSLRSPKTLDEAVGFQPPKENLPIPQPGAASGIEALRFFGGSVHSERFVTSLKWTLSGNSSSARVSLETAQNSVVEPEVDATKFQRAESDPTFLSKDEHGVWRGQSPLYITVERNDQAQRLTGTAYFSVQPGADGSSAKASVRVQYPSAGESHEPLSGDPFSLNAEETLSLNVLNQVLAEAP